MSSCLRFALLCAAVAVVAARLPCAPPHHPKHVENNCQLHPPYAHSSLDRVRRSVPYPHLHLPHRPRTTPSDRAVITLPPSPPSPPVPPRAHTHRPHGGPHGKPPLDDETTIAPSSAAVRHATTIAPSSSPSSPLARGLRVHSVKPSDAPATSSAAVRHATTTSAAPTRIRSGSLGVRRPPHGKPPLATEDPSTSLAPSPHPRNVYTNCSRFGCYSPTGPRTKPSPRRITKQPLFLSNPTH